MPRALITGITGQDGSYLAELLLAKGYEVFGLCRRSSTLSTGRIDHLRTDGSPRRPGVRLVYGDLTDGAGLHAVLNEIEPDEVYNLAAQSHVRVSFDQAVYTADVNALGTVRLLEAIRRMACPPRLYQASTSEMYGGVSDVPQNETMPFHPRSPYGCAKAFAFWQTVNYREAYNLFACNGILFNHESPRRGENFVTRKITRGAARIKLGLQDHLLLGNLDARRDWGFAGDYVKAMWLMLQQDKPDDYVIATGETRSVREFLGAVFGCLDLDWQEFVRIDPKLYRPAEVDVLVGDASKARRVLGWEPTVSFETLARMMVDEDLKHARQDAVLREHGNPAMTALSGSS